MEPSQKPSGPTVELSEPEFKRRLVEQGFSEAENRVQVVSVCAIKPILESAGLRVDEEGFICDSDGERMEPAVFDEALYYETTEPAEKPTHDYFSPKSDADDYFRYGNEIHLSDLHTLTYHEGDVYPVRDDMMNISRFRRCTGIVFPMVTRWSSAIDVLDDMPLFVIAKPLKEHELELSCLYCGTTKDVSEWTIKDGRPEEILCPDCETDWVKGTIYHCTECDELIKWSDYEDDGGGMYWEPYCTSCSASMKSLNTYNYSSLLDKNEQETLDSLQDTV